MVGGYYMNDNVNIGIACDVSTCRHNYQSCNCTLSKIKVGCTCNKESCTCCQSYSEKV